MVHPSCIVLRQILQNLSRPVRLTTFENTIRHRYHGGSDTSSHVLVYLHGALVRFRLSYSLRREGVTVVTSSSRQLALGILDSHPPSYFDVLLTDDEEFIQEVRERIPFIFAFGKCLHDVISSWGSGADHCLVGPVGLHVSLLALVLTSPPRRNEGNVTVREAVQAIGKSIRSMSDASPEVKWSVLKTVCTEIDKPEFEPNDMTNIAKLRWRPSNENDFPIIVSHAKAVALVEKVAAKVSVPPPPLFGDGATSPPVFSPRKGTVMSPRNASSGGGGAKKKSFAGTALRKRSVAPSLSLVSSAKKRMVPLVWMEKTEELAMLAYDRDAEKSTLVRDNSNNNNNASRRRQSVMGGRRGSFADLAAALRKEKEEREEQQATLHNHQQHITTVVQERVNELSEQVRHCRSLLVSMGRDVADSLRGGIITSDVVLSCAHYTATSTLFDQCSSEVAFLSEVWAVHVAPDVLQLKSSADLNFETLFVSQRHQCKAVKTLSMYAAQTKNKHLEELAGLWEEGLDLLMASQITDIGGADAETIVTVQVNALRDLVGRLIQCIAHRLHISLPPQYTHFNPSATLYTLSFRLEEEVNTVTTLTKALEDDIGSVKRMLHLTFRSVVITIVLRRFRKCLTILTSQIVSDKMPTALSKAIYQTQLRGKKLIDAQVALRQERERILSTRETRWATVVKDECGGSLLHRWERHFQMKDSQAQHVSNQSTDHFSHHGDGNFKVHILQHDDTGSRGWKEAEKTIQKAVGEATHTLHVKIKQLESTITALENELTERITVAKRETDSIQMSYRIAEMAMQTQVEHHQRNTLASSNNSNTSSGRPTKDFCCQAGVCQLPPPLRSEPTLPQLIPQVVMQEEQHSGAPLPTDPGERTAACIRHMESQNEHLRRIMEKYPKLRGHPPGAGTLGAHPPKSRGTDLEGIFASTTVVRPSMGLLEDLDSEPRHYASASAVILPVLPPSSGPRPPRHPVHMPQQSTHIRTMFPLAHIEPHQEDNQPPSKKGTTRKKRKNVSSRGNKKEKVIVAIEEARNDDADLMRIVAPPPPVPIPNRPKRTVVSGLVAS